jgi:hypothetical protein
VRPAGEIRRALSDAAEALFTPDRSPTLLELAHYAQVGYDAARQTVSNMKRAGHLVPVRRRKVDYRGKPVVEYCPRSRAQQQARPTCALHDAWSSLVA